MRFLQTALEWAGCFFALSGALLQALNIRISSWGFLLFLISNFAWLGYGYLASVHGISAMNIGFIFTSLLGLFRWRKSL